MGIGRRQMGMKGRRIGIGRRQMETIEKICLQGERIFGTGRAMRATKFVIEIIRVEGMADAKMRQGWIRGIVEMRGGRMTGIRMKQVWRRRIVEARGGRKTAPDDAG